MPLLTELGWRPGVSVATNMPLLRSCFAPVLFHRKQRGTKSRHSAASRKQPEGLAESSRRSPGAWGWRPPGNALADVMHPGRACQKDLARTPTVPPTPAIQIPSGGGSLHRPEAACVWFPPRKKDLATIRASALKHPHGSWRPCQSRPSPPRLGEANEPGVNSSFGNWAWCAS
jgi:hypothetical protein